MTAYSQLNFAVSKCAYLQIRALASELGVNSHCLAQYQPLSNPISPSRHEQI